MVWACNSCLWHLCIFVAENTYNIDKKLTRKQKCCLTGTVPAQSTVTAGVTSWLFANSATPSNLSLHSVEMLETYTIALAISWDKSWISMVCSAITSNTASDIRSCLKQIMFWKCERSITIYCEFEDSAPFAEPSWKYFTYWKPFNTTILGLIMWSSPWSLCLVFQAGDFQCSRLLVMSRIHITVSAITWQYIHHDWYQLR